MAQLHHSNDLAGTINASGHSFTAKVTGAHSVFVSSQTRPANGKLGWTGVVQIINDAGTVLWQSSTPNPVNLVAGTRYHWAITGTPNGNVLVDIDDGH